MATNTARSILNGVIGDHLEETGNDLAIKMAFYRNGEPVSTEEEEASFSTARRVCILVHGLTDNESTWTYHDSCGQGKEDYGQSLQRDFGGDITPLYVRYNTGLHVSTNGRHLDRLMNSLCRRSYPPCDKIQEIIFICHSMGGLVVRSACLAGTRNNSPWARKVGRVFFLGTPHQGSYWEKAGNTLSNALGAIPRPYMRLAADVSNLRSAGIKDLRFGYIADEDWDGHDPDAFLCNTKKPAGLLDWATYYVVTGTATKNPQHPASLCFGDGLVGRASAEGRSHNEEHDLGISSDCICEFPGVVHTQLSSDPNVYRQIKHWMEQPWSAPRREWDDDTEEPRTLKIDAESNTETSRPQYPGKWAQRKGVAALVHTAVDKGVTAVEKVQNELTDEVYNVLSLTTPAVRNIQVVHEACVGGIYSIIRGVNNGIGEAAKFACDQMDEKDDGNPA